MPLNSDAVNDVEILYPSIWHNCLDKAYALSKLVCMVYYKFSQQSGHCLYLYKGLRFVDSYFDYSSRKYFLASVIKHH